MKIDLWNKGWVTDELSTVNPFEANLNEENRIKWVTDLAAVSRGKDSSKNPEKRYKMLLKEAAPDRCEGDCIGEPSRPFEFLPIVLIANDDTREILNTATGKPIHIPRQQWDDYIKSFGYFDWENAEDYENGRAVKIYTNMRACIKAGIPYEEIPYNTAEEIKTGKFFAIKSYTPMFVWAQDKTHCRIPSESASGRVVKEEDYWIPSDIFDKIIQMYEKDKLLIVDPAILQEQVADFLKNENAEIGDEQIKIATLEMFDNMIYSNEQFAIPSYILGDEDALIELLLNWSQKKVTRFFEELGYPLEIAGRAIYYFKYKLMVRTGWGIDPRSWMHYFLERKTVPEKWKNWTQQQTAEEAKTIKEIFEKNFGKVI